MEIWSKSSQCWRYTNSPGLLGLQLPAPEESCCQRPRWFNGQNEICLSCLSLGKTCPNKKVMVEVTVNLHGSAMAWKAIT